MHTFQCLRIFSGIQLDISLKYREYQRGSITSSNRDGYEIPMLETPLLRPDRILPLEPHIADKMCFLPFMVIVLIKNTWFTFVFLPFWIPSYSYFTLCIRKGLKSGIRQLNQNWSKLVGNRKSIAYSVWWVEI